MKTMKPLTFLLAALMLLLPGATRSWEPYDQVFAVVNSEPIVQSEIEARFGLVQKQKNIAPKTLAYEKSRVLDAFIEDALIRETADRESIVISDVRVVTHIERVMSQFFIQKLKKQQDTDVLVGKLSKRLTNQVQGKKNVKDDALDSSLQEFISFIETNQKMPFSEYFEEVRREMRKDQVMSISIGVTPPSNEEALKWYNQNRKQIGDEVWVKHILIKPRSSSFAEEKKANDTLTEIRNQITKGASFEEMARKHSEDAASAKNGGDLGWVMLAELDPYFAGNVNQMSRQGQISQVFKSGLGYHVAKFHGKRPVQFEKVKRMILYKLYAEGMAKQFDKWVMQRKKTSDIKIYMKEYVEPKST
jgi:putative peptidyl-prolyl cis-trans isomerase